MPDKKIAGNSFQESARHCLRNAERLLDEAQFLEYEKPPATMFFLSIISQEECAKGFLLKLVELKIIPWNKFIHRATRDHRCKQLLGLILDYLTQSGDFDFDDYMLTLERAKRENRVRDVLFPKKILDAIHILRYEKIGRWESNLWCWNENPVYDLAALHIADGGRDRNKQRSLYVELSSSGEVSSAPISITDLMAKSEYERARNYVFFLKRSLYEGEQIESHSEWISENFRKLFSDPIGSAATWNNPID